MDSPTGAARITLGQSQPVKDAPVGRVDRDHYMVGARRVRHSEPTSTEIIGLSLQTPARVRPRNVQLVARQLDRQHYGGSEFVNDSAGSVCGGVGYQGVKLAISILPEAMH